MENLTVNGNNVRRYLDKNGTMYINLEDVAIGLGFTQIKGDKESIKWRTIINYLGIKDLPEYITQQQLTIIIDSTSKPVNEEWLELAGIQI